MKRSPGAIKWPLSQVTAVRKIVNFPAAIYARFSGRIADFLPDFRSCFARFRGGFDPVPIGQDRLEQPRQPIVTDQLEAPDTHLLTPVEGLQR